MNIYTQILKDGRYELSQIIQLATNLGYSAIGFATRYWSSDSHPSVYMIKDGILIPTSKIVTKRTWGDKLQYPTCEDVDNCFRIPADANRQSTEDSVSYSSKYGYADDDGQVYEISVTTYFKRPANESGYYSYDPQLENFSHLTMKTRKVNSLKHFDTFLNSQPELKRILENKNKYVAKFAEDKKVKFLEVFLMAPYLEILYKADFSFAKRFIDRVSDIDRPCSHYINLPDQTDLDKINRLCQQGNNPKEIFKCPKELYEALKNEDQLSVWDHLRVMCKMDNLTPDAALLVIQNNYSARDLRLIREILNKRYDDKPIFTFETLVNYLRRIDMYEAIPAFLGLELLRDYLSMCHQLNMEPKIDGDSLKREHDVTARLCWEKRDEIHNERIQKRAEELSQYNYKNDTYFIRAITSQPDLLTEARQQHNCVASYARMIADKQSNIFVCRRVDNPDASLVTIETNPATTSIRQKYMAYNKPIYNKELTEFIEEWIKWCSQKGE